MRLRLDLRRGSGYLPAGDVIPGGAAEGVPRDGQRIGHVRGNDGERDAHPDIVDAPTELGRDLRRGDRRIDGIGQARSKSARTAPQARHPPRRGTVSRTA